MIVLPGMPEFTAALPLNYPAIWAGAPQRWAEAEVIAAPVKEKLLKEPRVLVRRIVPELTNSRDEDVFCLPGHPTISLFTGAGGMDIGTESAGFCTVVQHEWSNDACQTLIANRPNYFRHAALIQGDIRKTPTSMLLKEANLRVGEAHLVCGGPPCQGFSTANSNSGSGKYDPRNDLLFEFLRVVREAQPMFFVMENVPGFCSFPGKRDGRTYIEQFLWTAHNCYYELVYGLLNASAYHVPQDRTRFLCMGTRRDLVEIDGKLASLPEPQCFAQGDLNTIRQLEGGLFQREVNLLKHAPGIRYFPDRPVLKPPRPTHDGQVSEAFLKFFEKLERDEPDRIVRRPSNERN